MDTPVIIIGLVLIAIVVFPLYFVLRANQLDKNQIKTLFAQNSQDNKYQFELIATHNRKALGIDSKKKGLLFIDFNLKEPYVSFQDLKQSESCKVATSSPQGKSNVLKKVEWFFMSKKGIPQSNTVLFHDADNDYIVPVYAQEELKLAQQWQEVIQKHL
ncbi:hypothetical protein [Flavobacterium sangjuense]|uniref:Uncharacterized protein n=1 Tax=Flavobacterium sangjuense TaxID=2518177 RepID=A0A4P7PS35_9FLAO|nr:hypothetical protein [Flavobacterium sangjuense]QBZ97345.1 hypothetical protein GS03_00833 [Flavobacterium sangjuense]